MNETESQSRLEMRVEKSILWVITFLVAVLPISFSWFLFDSFALPKVTVLRLTSGVLLFLTLAKLLYFSKAEMRRTKADLAVLLFLFLLFVSTLFSIDRLTSLLGEYRRYESMLTFLSYGIIFFSATQIASPWRRKLIARVVAVSGFVVAAYGLIQYLGYDPLGWYSSEANRSLSSFGNSVLLGEFLVLVLPVTVVLFLNSSKVVGRLFMGLMLLTVFAALMTTFSRGAWLAAIFGAGILAFYYRKTILRGKKALALVALLVLALVFVQVSFISKSIPLGELGYRALSAFDPQQSSVKQRLIIWKTAFSGISKRPLLGYGPGTFPFMFYRLESVDQIRLLFQSGLASAVVDHAHNYIIHMSSTAGIPATLVFHVIIFLAIAAGWQRKTGDEDAAIKQGLLAGVLGYLVALLFGVGTAGSSGIFWIMLGVLMGNESWRREIVWKKRSRVLRIGLLLVVAAAGLYYGLYAVLSLEADRHFQKALTLNHIKNYPAAAKEFQVALNLNPLRDNYRGELGLNYFEWAQVTRDRQLLDLAIYHLRKAERISPLAVHHYLFLGEIYRFAGMWFDPAYFVQAEKELRAAVEIFPNSPRAHYLLGLVALLQGNLKEGDVELARARSIIPEYQVPYYGLGQYFETQGEVERAKEMYLRALKDDPQNARAALERLGVK